MKQAITTDLSTACVICVRTFPVCVDMFACQAPAPSSALAQMV